MIVVRDARMRGGLEIAESYDLGVAVAADINIISICAAGKNRLDTKTNTLFSGTSLCNRPNKKAASMRTCYLV